MFFKKIIAKSYLYGDKNVNTIGNLARAVGGINMPTMQKMGLGNITDIMGVEPTNNPIASFGKMDELSNGKDTMTGHWEIMGLEVKTPFLTFSEHGFPQELVDELDKKEEEEVTERLCRKYKGIPENLIRKVVEASEDEEEAEIKKKAYIVNDVIVME